MNYFQQQSPRFSAFPPVIKNLLIANILAYIATLMLGSQFDLVDKFGMHYFESSKFHFYQIITCMFLHDGFLHIALNMYGLWLFGQMIENYYGSKRFLLLYFICGIGAGIIQEASLYVYYHHIFKILETFNSEPSLPAFDVVTSKYFTGIRGYPQPQTIDDAKMVLKDLYQFSIDNSNTIGASGAIFGVLIAFAMIYPEVQLFLMFIPIPVKAKYAIPGYCIIELYSGLAGNAGDNVAHFAHLGGALFGVIMVLYWRKRGGIY
ncbi:MAG: rhomboid family intramembrane serine protease [Bacteroidia bacterium]